MIHATVQYRDKKREERAEAVAVFHKNRSGLGKTRRKKKSWQEPRQQ